MSAQATDNPQVTTVDKHDELKCLEVFEHMIQLLHQMNELSVSEVMQHAINEATRLTRSEIGFFHFVDMEEQAVQLMVWSDKTLRYCSIPELVDRYPFAEAGVWLDVIKTQAPVIVNDYASLPHKRGLPKGHVPLTRMLSVPVKENGDIVAIMGVGNKADDYDDFDQQQLMMYAQLAWGVTQRKRAETALKDAKQALELRVEDRTRELIAANTRYQEEIRRRESVEHMLRVQQLLLEDTQRVGHIGHWSYTLATQEIFWSSLIYDLFERDYTLGPPCKQSDGQYDVPEWNFIMSAIDHITTTKEKYHFEFAVTLPDNSLRYLLGFMLPQIDDNGNVSRIMGLFQDFTERYEAEQVRMDLELGQEQMRILSDFIRSASHEFRTPLSIINTSAYLLGRKTPESHQRHIASIEKQVHRLKHLLDDLFIMTRLDQKQTMELLATNINTLVDIALVSCLPQDRDLHIIKEYQAKLSQLFCSDEHLTLAVRHILDNAVRFTPDGGEITITTRQVADTISIEIADTGIGISSEDLPHVFERFFRVDESHSIAGFGLGLPIAQAIIHLHGGKIELESTLHVGTLVRVLLPVN